MTESWSALLGQAHSLSLREVSAVLFAIAYLLLAIRQNIWCWLCAGISTGLYIHLFIEARLYMEALLNVFYLAMALYGWYSWTHVRGDQEERVVTSWPWSYHLAAVMMIVAAAGASGLLLASQTEAAYPYADSATTWGAVWATFLIARKVLENWWYWLVIDSASVFLYWSRELELTALLFIAYVVMIPFGLASWRRSMRQLQA